MTRHPLASIGLALGLLPLAGCIHGPPAPPAATFRPAAATAWSPELRTVEAPSEAALLSAASDTFQDLGYMLVRSETSLGVLTAERIRPGPPSLENLFGVVAERQAERLSVSVRPSVRPSGGWIVQTSWTRMILFPLSDQVLRIPAKGQPPLSDEFFAVLRTKLAPSAVP